MTGGISMAIQVSSIRSLVIRAMKGSYLGRMLGNKKGVVIPFPMVHAVGDIIIVKHISPPAVDEEGPGEVATAPIPEAEEASSQLE
jgi:sporulation protein YlmC with PRC-barrel domain